MHSSAKEKVSGLTKDIVSGLLIQNNIFLSKLIKLISIKRQLLRFKHKV
jgi:hypothetical protein